MEETITLNDCGLKNVPLGAQRMATIIDEIREADIPAQPAEIDRLSVIVPVYSEERTVAELLRRLEAQPCVSQIIIVDDGSTDRTWEELGPWRARSTFTEATSVPCGDSLSVIVVQHEKNRGKGRAIRTGLDLVTCSHVIIQDADLEYDPADINELWVVMQSGKADVVFGSRYLQNSALQKGRWFMQSGVRFLNLLVRLLYGIRLTDEATCYKLFRTADLRSLDLHCERFEFCPEVVAKIAIRNLKVLEFPVHYRARQRKDGKKLTAFDALHAVHQLVVFHPKLNWWHNSKFRFVATLAVGSFLAIVIAGCIAGWLGIPKALAFHTTGHGTLERTHQTYEIGTTTPGSTMSREIEIPNTTAMPWTIVGNTTTCGCTKVLLDSTEVPRGSVLKGTVTVKSPLVRGPYTVGVEFNTVDGSVVGVTIHGAVAPSFSVVPSALRISNDVTPYVRFDAALFTAERLVIQSAPSWCVVTMSEPDNSSVTGTLSIKPGTDPALSRTGKLVVSDEHGFRQTIDIRLDSHCRFVVHPTALHFGEIKANTPSSTPLVVELKNRGVDGSWPEISCDDAHIRIDVQPQNGNIMRATVSVCESRPGIYSTQITLADKNEKVTIPVHFKVIE